MPPDNTVIRLEQLEGRPGEHIVGEVERWRALTWPASFTLDSLDRPPESQWICSGEILSQTADLKEVEIRWTEASDSEMLGFLATDSFSAMTVYLNLKVRHTRPKPASTTPAFPALIDPMGFPETIPRPSRTGSSSRQSAIRTSLTKRRNSIRNGKSRLLGLGPFRRFSRAWPRWDRRPRYES